MVERRERTKRAATLCMAVGSVLVLASACEREVPDRLWDATVASCRRAKACGSLDGSVQECAEFRTKFYFWDETTEECVDAMIAYRECEATAPCDEWSTCEVPFQISVYNCGPVNTRVRGVLCGDPGSAKWEHCGWLCGGGYSNTYEGPHTGHLCSEQTPDYCLCGTRRCAIGEYCCICSDEDG